MRSLNRRGFLIILGLLILALSLVLGFGLMSAQQARYRGAGRSLTAYQALELARAGLEDARVKLERDQGFPPKPADDQLVFTYSEDVKVQGTAFGSYFVTVDWTHQADPYNTWVITSTGTVGPKDKPLAQRTLRAELHKEAPPSDLLRWVRLEDTGSL